MFYLIYVSSAIQPFTRSELIDLLTKARENNRQLGITGMLLYKDGNIMQVLEGEEATVRQLYEVISQDPRHRGIILLDQGETATRQFSRWSMGFRNLDDPEIKSMPGFSEFMNNKPLDAKVFQSNPSACWQLLNMFREEM